MPRRAVRNPGHVPAAEKWFRRHYGNRSFHPCCGFVLCRLTSNRPHIATALAFSTRNADLAEVCSLVRDLRARQANNGTAAARPPGQSRARSQLIAGTGRLLAFDARPISGGSALCRVAFYGNGLTHEIGGTSLTDLQFSVCAKGPRSPMQPTCRGVVISVQITRGVEADLELNQFRFDIV